MSNRRTILLTGGLIVAAGVAAYWQSFGAPFAFRELPESGLPPGVPSSWPIPAATGEGGVPTGGGSVLQLTWGFNHAVSGRQPWSYHVFNLLIHLMSGLWLFGLSRRVLPRVAGGRGFASAPVEPKHPDRVVPPYHLKVFATPAACAIALLWVLHPLQTQAVTEVSERAVPLSGCGYLLTVYAFVRMAGAGGGWKWGAWSVLGCLLAQATSGEAVTAPLFVLLADRVFYCDGLWAALRKRPLYYLALAGTWLLPGWQLLHAGGLPAGGAPFSREAFGTYWLTQPEALTRYLGLAIWPHPLVFDYGLAADPRIAVRVGCALMLALLLGLTGWLWWKRRPEAIGPGAFFLLLAPTSLVPGAETIAEPRMYLPLAALLGVLVAATTAWVGRRGLALCFALAVAAGLATANRNHEYLDPVRLWTETIEKRPGNARAHDQLGLVLQARGEIHAATTQFARAVDLAPAWATAHFHLGQAFLGQGRAEEAKARFAEAVRLQPDLVSAREALRRLGNGAGS